MSEVTLLLDTHTLLWFVEDEAALSDRARAAIEDLDNTPTYSIVSVWEMAIKISVGKLAVSRPLYPEFAHLLQERGFEQLQISYRHASEVARLPWHHRDPFDRLLIAQASVENLPIVSIDTAFDHYPVTRLW